MKSHIIALAALAAIGFVGGAYAEDAKPKLDAPTVMSDSEMDKVTAGGWQVFAPPGSSTARACAMASSNASQPNAPVFNPNAAGCFSLP